MTNKALFLDRDGVINHNYGYVHTIENFDFIDGIFELVQSANIRNYNVCVVTNQAGIGRGLYTENQFNFLTNWMCSYFENQGCKIDKVYFSPYHPIHGLGKYKKNDYSRKPNPGMMIDAINDFNLDPEACILIGDKETDVLAGLEAKIGTNLIIGDYEKSLELDNKNVFYISRLHEAIQFLQD